MTMKMLNRNNATCNVVCVNEPSGKGIYTDCSHTLVRYFLQWKESRAEATRTSRFERLQT
jgi:hypothetical protein